jgi:hypothetical protein
MRRADIQISAELLRDLLEFPKDVVIVGDATGNVILTVESDLIPEGSTEVLATWIKKGRDAKPEFLKFEPTRIPTSPLVV